MNDYVSTYYALSKDAQRNIYNECITLIKERLDIMTESEYKDVLERYCDLPTIESIADIRLLFGDKYGLSVTDVIKKSANQDIENANYYIYLDNQLFFYANAFDIYSTLDVADCILSSFLYNPDSSVYAHGYKYEWVATMFANVIRRHACTIELLVAEKDALLSIVKVFHDNAHALGYTRLNADTDIVEDIIARLEKA